jgi:predicted porin
VVQRLRVASISGAALGLSLAAGSLQAQKTPDDHHDFHHNHVGVLVGGMTPLSETSETSWAIGAEYEYRFNEKWGTGLGVDFTFGDHKRTALVATGVSYRLTPAFKVGTGPGLEMVEKDTSGGGTETKPYFLWGFAAAYEFHVGSFSLTPTVYLDFVGETKTNLTYGLAIGTGF